jgi:hypothetical protein
MQGIISLLPFGQYFGVLDTMNAGLAELIFFLCYIPRGREKVTSQWWVGTN